MLVNLSSDIICGTHQYVNPTTDFSFIGTEALRVGSRRKSSHLNMVNQKIAGRKLAVVLQSVSCSNIAAFM